MNGEATENRGLRKSIFEHMLKVGEAIVFNETMELKLSYLGKGLAGMKMIPKPEYSTPGGRVHGGIISALADSVMGAAASTIDGKPYRTVEMNLNYIGPAFEKKEITAEGRVTHPGRTIRVIECSLFDHERKLIAQGRGTFIRDTKFSPDVLNI